MTKSRDDLLVEIRPILYLNTAGNGPVEHFQNRVLRPLLKFQNPLLIQWFKIYLHQREPLFNAYTGAEQKKIIVRMVKQDVNVKNTLLPLIIGLFTSDEVEFYLANRKEVNRRITSMLIQRFQDQLGSLVKKEATQK